MAGGFRGEQGESGQRGILFSPFKVSKRFGTVYV